MPSKNYLHFSAEDFASDSYFQKWMLEDDHMTNLFWEKWLAKNPEKRTKIDLAKKIIYQFRFKEYKASSEDFNDVWKNLKETHIGEINTVHSSKKKWHIGTAAAIILLISSVAFFYKEFKKRETQIASPIIINNNIQTGTDKAILTLADGSNIKLIKGKTYNTQNANSDGREIVYNTNSTSKKITYNYLTTPRGGQFFVKLSDGTQVWLNSQSQLKYPVTFASGKTREVKLIYGEAYFDVSPSTEHKGATFKVINSLQEIEVLGTQFNIKAYKNDATIYTTLIEGKVMVSVMNKDLILAPNQQLKLNLTNNITTIYKVDAYRETSWKKGVFSFKNKPLKDIMKVLSRWYEIEVIFDSKLLEKTIFNGTLKKKLSITDIMEAITNANNISYEINNKTVLLKSNIKPD